MPTDYQRVRRQFAEASAAPQRQQPTPGAYLITDAQFSDLVDAVTLLASATEEPQARQAQELVRGVVKAARRVGEPEQRPNLPPLRPLFRRLGELHPDWQRSERAPYYAPNGETYWALDEATIRDQDWMFTHLNLIRDVISTIAGLGWSYDWETGRKEGPLAERWASVHRGHTEYVESGYWDGPEWVDDTEEVFVSHGPKHRASGPTDLHALLAALVAALEAEPQKVGG